MQGGTSFDAQEALFTQQDNFNLYDREDRPQKNSMSRPVNNTLLEKKTWHNCLLKQVQISEQLIKGDYLRDSRKKEQRTVLHLIRP